MAKKPLGSLVEYFSDKMDDRFVRVPEKILLEALNIASEISKDLPVCSQPLFKRLQVKLNQLKERSTTDETVTGKRYFTF